MQQLRYAPVGVWLGLGMQAQPRVLGGCYVMVLALTPRNRQTGRRVHVHLDAIVASSWTVCLSGLSVGQDFDGCRDNVHREPITGPACFRVLDSVLDLPNASPPAAATGAELLQLLLPCYLRRSKAGARDYPGLWLRTAACAFDAHSPRSLAHLDSRIRQPT